MAQTRVLFLCVHNSARSQMAEGWLRARGDRRFEVHSAGMQATRVRPEAIAVMAELGVDISGQESKTFERYQGQAFDYVITACDEAKEACPRIPGGRQLHWTFPDPAGTPGSAEVRLAAFRVVRDAIRTRIDRELLGAR